MLSPSTLGTTKMFNQYVDIASNFLELSDLILIGDANNFYYACTRKRN